MDCAMSVPTAPCTTAKGEKHEIKDGAPQRAIRSQRTAAAAAAVVVYLLAQGCWQHQQPPRWGTQQTQPPHMTRQDVRERGAGR